MQEMSLDWRTAYNELMEDIREAEQRIIRMERMLMLMYLLTPPEMLDRRDEESGLTLREAMEEMI